MSAAIWGTVIDGKIVPHSPLPEGAQVQIVVCPERDSAEPVQLSGEEQQELDSWVLASAKAIELVEDQADKDEHHAAR